MIRFHGILRDIRSTQGTDHPSSIATGLTCPHGPIIQCRHGPPVPHAVAPLTLVDASAVAQLRHSITLGHSAVEFSRIFFSVLVGCQT